MSNELPAKLVLRAEQAQRLCESMYIPENLPGRLTQLWQWEMSSNADMIRSVLKQYQNVGAVENVVSMVEVRIDCYKRIRESGRWSSPLDLCKVTNQITRIICAPIFPDKLKENSQDD